MASISCVNELEDSVLGYICDMVDSLSIVQLLRVGNRLLTLKLCSPYGISRYCDVGEYGSYIGPLQWILPQLKGLKTVSITSNVWARVGSLLADIIPSTVTSIELYGQDCLEACFEKRKGKEEHFLNFSSRFPSLQSLSLWYHDKCAPDPESSDNEDQPNNLDIQVYSTSNNGDKPDDDSQIDENQNDIADNEANSDEPESGDNEDDIADDKISVCSDCSCCDIEVPPREYHEYRPRGYDGYRPRGYDRYDRYDGYSPRGYDRYDGYDGYSPRGYHGYRPLKTSDSKWIAPDYGGMENKSWLDIHIPLFPPTLTRLCLNEPSSFKTPIKSMRFPATLEHLEIGSRVLRSLSWIFSLPLLHTLKIVRVQFVQDIDESFENLQPPNISTLHFSFRGRGFRAEDELIKLLHRMESLFPALPQLQHFGLIPTELDYRSNKGAWRTSLNHLANLQSLSCPYPYDANLTLPQTLVELRWLRMDKGHSVSKLSREEVIRLPPSLTILYAPLQELGRDDFALLPRTLTSLTIDCDHIKGFEYSTLPPLLTYFDCGSYSWERLATRIEAISKYLPHLHTLSGLKHQFYVTTTKNLSISKTGWTNLMYAAYMEDFDALHRLVVEYMKLPDLDEEEKISMIWRDAYDGLTELAKGEDKIQLPLTSLNWFRLRGLCSYPRRVDQVSFYQLLNINIKEPRLSTATFFQWAGPYLG